MSRNNFALPSQVPVVFGQNLNVGQISDLLYTFVLEEKLIKWFCLKFRFVEPPVLDMAAVVEDSSTRTPLIFVLSPGVVSLFVKVKTFFHGFLVTCSHCCSKRW